MSCSPSATPTLLKTSVITPLLFRTPHTFQLRPNVHQLSFPTTSISTNCSTSTVPSPLSWSEEDSDYSDYTDEDDEGDSPADGRLGHAPPLRSTRRRYRKQYPGERVGITEEMRFVAMKLRNSGKPKSKAVSENVENVDEEIAGSELSTRDDNDGCESWEPSVEGFLKYLVDSKHVFSIIERIVDESTDVSYVYFRKTGLERTECLSSDLEWFRQEGNVIPEPSNPGITYAKYLEEIAEKSPALFMSHFYNIYFSHIAGGQVIAKKVSKKLLGGRELEFFKWEGNEAELLRGVREKLNMLGEHWSRDVKNKCLREATKSFRSLGQIVRLIIL